MTIRPGQEWGEVLPVPVPADHSFASDAALGRWLADEPLPTSRTALLTGGDLLASVGGPSVAGTRRRYPIDVLRVELDTDSAVGVAHVVCRRPGPFGWWRGRLLAVVNTSKIGPWDVAPRAHPNDGRFDVVDVDATMTMRARWQARRRLTTGTHVPHPAIAVTRPRDRRATWDFGTTLTVWVDGRRVGRSRSLTITLEPDAATVLA